MTRFRLCLLVCLLATGTEVAAFESDVHFGLTRWLALKAGFDPAVATTIAIGDNRVDSGDMQFVDVVYMYACVGKDDVGARRAGEHHYPSTMPAPAAPDARAVVPGGDPAKSAAQGAVKVPPDQAAYRLYKLGEALHTFQDSWSHQGVPDTPGLGSGFSCDASRAWGHPKSRGGWSSHRADQTHFWPGETVAMAKATYEILTQYPSVAGIKRTPRTWEEIRPALDGFLRAATKSEKQAWFAAQGIDDVDFLAATSLKDGAKRFERPLPERNLPPLTSIVSRQHAVQADVLDFYNRFFARWVSATDFEALVAEFGPDVHEVKTRDASLPAAGKADLVARLKVWRLRDHGRVADIAHSLQPLTARERALVDAAAKEPNAYARSDPPAAAFFPLLPRGEGASPLLPFFIGTATAGAGKNPTAAAVTKFRHLPYDAVVVMAEKTGGRWRIVSIVAAVDH